MPALLAAKYEASPSFNPKNHRHSPNSLIVLSLSK
jgi:hypothetical protein